MDGVPGPSQFIDPHPAPASKLQTPVCRVLGTNETNGE